MSGCPDDASWQRWLDGDVERDERATLTSHLNDCDPCCAFVVALDPEASAVGPGTRIDRYELIELLGAGAMGLVYAAHDPRLERRVAVKLLRTRGTVVRFQGRSGSSKSATLGTAPWPGSASASGNSSRHTRRDSPSSCRRTNALCLSRVQ